MPCKGPTQASELLGSAIRTARPIVQLLWALSPQGTVSPPHPEAQAGLCEREQNARQTPLWGVRHPGTGPPARGDSSGLHAHSAGGVSFVAAVVGHEPPLHPGVAPSFTTGKPLGVRPTLPSYRGARLPLSLPHSCALHTHSLRAALWLPKPREQRGIFLVPEGLG